MNTDEMPVRRIPLGGGWRLQRFEADNGPFLVLIGPTQKVYFCRCVRPDSYPRLLDPEPN